MAKKNRDDKAPAGQSAPESSRWTEYFWANLVFFSFLFVLALVVRTSCESPADEPAVKLVLDETFRFLLLLFGGGFLLVTLFDAAYEFFAARAQEDGGGPQA